jgi:anti-sigma regulatory factor (Ser/Thr protein kinase)
MDVRTSTRLRRERASVPAARAFVRHALRSGGASVDSIERLELATAEACNNAVVHAVGASFTVDVVIDDDQAMVAVADNGAGFVPQVRRAMPSPWATGNRGIPLMEALVEQVDVYSGDSGTTVVLMQPLGAGDRAAQVAVDR